MTTGLTHEPGTDVRPPMPVAQQVEAQPFQRRVLNALPEAISRRGLLTRSDKVRCGERYGADVAILLGGKTSDELMGIARVYGYRTGAMAIRLGNTETDRLIDIAARAFGVTRQQIKGQQRTQRVAMARFFVVYWVYRRTGLSLPVIGRMFGGRDHTTILNATRKWPERRAYARVVRALIREGQPINSREEESLKALRRRIARYAGYDGDGA